MRIIITLIISIVFISSHLISQDTGPSILKIGFGDDNSGQDKIKWKKIDLSDYDIIWIHKNDTLPSNHGSEFYNAMLRYTDAGGSILLTQHAMHFLNESGLEPVNLERRQKTSEDNGYGRMLGFHAFRHHPLFDSLHGGAYIWKPPYDTTVTQYGFFEEQVPQLNTVSLRSRSLRMVRSWPLTGIIFS